MVVNVGVFWEGLEKMAFKVTRETMKALCRDVKLTKPQATEKKSLIVLRLVFKFF